MCTQLKKPHSHPHSLFAPCPPCLLQAAKCKDWLMLCQAGRVASGGAPSLSPHTSHRHSACTLCCVSFLALGLLNTTNLMLPIQQCRYNSGSCATMLCHAVLCCSHPERSRLLSWPAVSPCIPCAHAVAHACPACSTLTPLQIHGVPAHPGAFCS